MHSRIMATNACHAQGIICCFCYRWPQRTARSCGDCWAMLRRQMGRHRRGLLPSQAARSAGASACHAPMLLQRVLPPEAPTSCHMPSPSPLRSLPSPSPAHAGSSWLTLQRRRPRALPMMAGSRAMTWSACPVGGRAWRRQSWRPPTGNTCCFIRQIFASWRHCLLWTVR